MVDDLSYQGDTLIVPRGYASKAAVVSAVSTLMKKLLGGDIAAIINRFASFNSNPVLLASKVFSPFSWPTESSALTNYMRKMPIGGARAMRRNAGDAFWRQLHSSRAARAKEGGGGGGGLNYTRFNSACVRAHAHVISAYNRLTTFGYSEIQQLSSNFADALQQQGYSPESCIEEWPKL